MGCYILQVPWVLPPLSNSWIIVIIWLYIALNRTPNIDCYWVGAVPNKYHCGDPFPRSFRLGALDLNQGSGGHNLNPTLILGHTSLTSNLDEGLKPT